MNTILCYGDSNTWGYDPATQERFTPDVCWTGVLARELGAGYRVIEEGLNGRTTVWDDPVEGRMSGKEYLVPCLESHRPLDLVALMLGTNDLKMRFSVSAFDIAQSAGVLVDIIRKSAAGPNTSAPHVLLMAPPIVGEIREWAEMFQDAVFKSKKFGEYYRRVAEEHHCHFMDTAPLVVSSPLDGIHFEADQHAKLGKAVAARVREILK